MASNNIDFNIKLDVKNMSDMFTVYRGEEYNKCENTEKVLIPVSAQMLDVLTERPHDERGGGTLLEEIGSLRNVMIVVQIHVLAGHWDEGHEEEDNLVYAIGVFGSFHDRENTRSTLMNIIEMEEEKLSCKPGISRNRTYGRKYFRMKMEKNSR